MMRNLTDAAPKEGEQAFSSGTAAAGGAEGAEDGAQRAVAGRMMGDLATSGDAPFGGEVQVDSRVRALKALSPPLDAALSRDDIIGTHILSGWRLWAFLGKRPRQ
jgi:hypothetical protein